jgi:hypothetical protein
MNKRIEQVMKYWRARQPKSHRRGRLGRGQPMSAICQAACPALAGGKNAECRLRMIQLIASCVAGRVAVPAAAAAAPYAATACFTSSSAAREST